MHAALRPGPSRELRVTVAGGALPVADLGEGEALLFLHGWTLDRRVWAPQLQALGAGFRTIAFNRRGTGRDTPRPELAAEVDDIGRILDALAIDRAVMVAMSQGTRVALAFALAHPERVCGLVLQGPPLPFRGAADPVSEAVPVDTMARLAAAGEFAAMRALWRRHPLAALDTDTHATLMGEILADYCGRDLLCPSAPLEIAPEALATLDRPTLLLTGSRESAYRHAAAALLARHLPQAERRTIAGGSHLCNLSHPDDFNAAVADFASACHAQ